MNIMKPWETPTYNAQVKTFAIAQELTGDTRNVTPISAVLEPPHCLRIVKAYRTSAIQSFRDQVAAETRKRKQHAN